jgi:hypothetical protein
MVIVRFGMIVVNYQPIALIIPISVKHEARCALDDEVVLFATNYVMATLRA